MRVPWCLLLLLPLAGCVDDDPPVVDDDAPATMPSSDPLDSGSLQVESALYDLGIVVGHDPELVVYQYPIQKTGSIHYPTSGEGPFPLIILMHGRHGTCAILGAEGIGTHVCPSAVVVEPVNSFTGYDGLAANLASHGYVVASINANQINDRDLAGDSGANARAELTLATIDDLATVNATGGSGLDDLQGRIDVSRIGLMGHSRGGEGVTRAITMNLARAAPLDIKAVFALAPTDFARWAAPDVAFATLLPYCDGDVYNLQGAWIYDDARDLPGGPRYQVLAMGANHNFYNTVWTFDDWGTSGQWCGSEAEDNGRDSPDSQRAHGYGLMASFFRLHVGGETEFAAMWRGDVEWPTSFCPDQEDCDDRLLLSRHGDGRRMTIAPDGKGEPTDEGMRGSSCAAATCTAAMYSVAQATQYEWDSPGLLRFPVDVPAGVDRLTFRVALPPLGADVDLEVGFVSGGSSLNVSLAGHPGLATPPMGSEAKGILSMIAVPFPQGLDPAALTAVELRFAGAGTIFIADVMLQD